MYDTHDRVRTKCVRVKSSTYRHFFANSQNPVFFLRTPRIKFFPLALPRGKTRRFATLARCFALVSYLLAEIISRSFLLAHFGWILVICCPGCLFDTQDENVLNRTEAAAKVGQNASTHVKNLLDVRPSGNSRLKLQQMSCDAGFFGGRGTLPTV